MRQASGRATAAAAQRRAFAIAILAAGKGTRLKSKRPKVLHEIGGKPLLAHVIAAAAQVADPKDIYVIIGHEAEKVRAAVADTGVSFILQKEQRGTGHAIKVARDAISKYKHVLVLSGDVPLIRAETIRRVRDFHQKRRAAMTVLTAMPADPGGYGRVLRAKGAEIAAIVEAKALTKAQHSAREINSGIYAFETKPLYRHVDKLKTANAHREFYLTDMAALLGKAKQRVLALPAGRASEVLGANTVAELVQLDADVRAQKAAALMSVGVTIYRPETCVIDAAVEVGADTVIEPFVQLLGTTRIGPDCRIRSYSVISDSELAAGVTIRNGCIVDRSRIARGATVGPYSHLRPDSEIGEGAHIGNFVETKKARVGKGSKANHLTYLGDAAIGDNVNIGAGTITCNYDGAEKHGTVIDDGAFIGSDSTLVAPVRIGKDAYVGAGSCITESVPAEALAIGRGRQVIKEGWVGDRRARQPRATRKD
ncbi:MAG: bifunctional UDP-N-acetylglucosamine diphosphorylase/glucosamine-1-phosphate N-acetyltransferase GlmU [Candidatus Koribacter versatilis]|uniref:Bifunctional protein GlmU n=1 Tax=Candidatus Korobacter versatilis TaxID=658062 RepID=A0A932A650_9BACT|nr:bifunctional UDP-N-acetylglucosamine diphosphorylase/glucosamine-1-phosphate N-acetyltransferase GlmU [Candidatus Koribacter versatilis]